MKREMIETLIKKETLLSEIVAWLKEQGLWEECQKSLSVKIVKKRR